MMVSIVIYDPLRSVAGWRDYPQYATELTDGTLRLQKRWVIGLKTGAKLAVECSISYTERSDSETECDRI